MSNAKAKATPRVGSTRTSTEKEAKALAAELANLLSKRDPWHQDVVFARENLRRHCLALIFQAPPENNAVSAAIQARKRLAGLNVLFLSTSHNVIHHFRQRLSAIDAALSDKTSDKSSSKRSKDDRSGKSGASGPTPGQRRKLLHSFRDFLVMEETFWRDLLIRIVGVFDVEEARTSLRLLQIGVGDWEPDPALAGDKQIRESAIILCHKTLICYGDLARYRELYSDKPAASSGSSSGHKAHNTSKAGQKDAIAGKTFARAYEAYHQARLLLPDDGNPSNQLAVLAGYQGDQLSCIYHYYRALCVKKAFTTASQNLSATMAKILKQWQSEQTSKRDKRRLASKSGSYADLDADPVDRAQEPAPAETLEQFKKDFVVLHAMLFQGTDTENLPTQFKSLNRIFSLGVRRRHLPSDVIVKTVVTALGSWWYARMYKRAPTEGEPARASNASLESSALMHTLAIITELLNVGVAELGSVNPDDIARQISQVSDGEENMIVAQSISAVVRRTLPALRIASMWLLSNGDYLSRYDSTNARHRTDDPDVPQEVCIAIRSFWSTYIAFTNVLQAALPHSMLKATTADFMLEEDIDMLGFSPLRRRLKETSSTSGSAVKSATVASSTAGTSLHPNEEQVLRLGDILADANLLAHSDSCPVIIERGLFAMRQRQLNPASQPWSPIKAAQPLDTSPIGQHVDLAAHVGDTEYASALHDEDMMEDVGNDDATEDDVLDLAMRVAVGETRPEAAHEHALAPSDDDEDDDEVVYRPPAGTIGDRRPSSRDERFVPRAPIANSSAASNPPSSRTASDLLLQVLQGNAMDLATEKANAAFFDEGQGPSNALDASLTGRSIWSSGMSTLPSTTVSLQPSALSRPPSTHQTKMMTQSASAETLFNSMPNQNEQKIGSNRSSPRMAAAAVFDGGRRALTPSGSMYHSAHGSLHGDAWSSPSSSMMQEHVTRSLPQSPNRPARKASQSATRQYGYG